MDELAQTIAAHKIRLKIKGASCTNSDVDFSMVHSVCFSVQKNLVACQQKVMTMLTEMTENEARRRLKNQTLMASGQ